MSAYNTQGTGIVVSQLPVGAMVWTPVAAIDSAPNNPERRRVILEMKAWTRV